MEAPVAEAERRHSQFVNDWLWTNGGGEMDWSPARVAIIGRIVAAAEARAVEPWEAFAKWADGRTSLRFEDQADGTFDVYTDCDCVHMEANGAGSYTAAMRALCVKLGIDLERP